MKLSKIIKNIKFEKKNFADVEISGITDNTADVKKNFLFAAKKGEKTDSHIFIGDAVKKGAKAIIHSAPLKNYDSKVVYLRISDKDDTNANEVFIKLCKNFYGNPSDKLKIIAITGTNGKTTISYLLKHILNYSGKKCLVIGTINANIGAKIFKIQNTTPGPFILYKLFKEAVDRKAEYAIMEASSHSIKQKRFDLRDVDCAAFTNLTQDHLDYHKTMEDYVASKSMLFKYMNKNGIAVVNIDDEYSKYILKNCGNLKTLTYSINKKSDITGKTEERSPRLNKFDIKFKNLILKIETGLIGRHNIYNILAAFGASQFLKIPANKFAEAIKKFKNVPGRLDKIRRGNGSYIFVDYAHTPDALYNVLNALSELKSSGRIITVFGCGGDRDRLKRPLMGKIAVEKSDIAIITSDNPRSEKPDDIIKEIENGCSGFDNYSIEPDRKKAIEKAVRAARKNDIVLIAGKGHENYQIIGKKIINFDDKKVSREIINRLKKGK